MVKKVKKSYSFWKCNGFKGENDRSEETYYKILNSVKL